MVPHPYTVLLGKMVTADVDSFPYFRDEHGVFVPYIYKTRGSTIGEGGETTISSPGRSPKQPLPGMRRHDPLHGRQACPEFIAFDRGLVKHVPGRAR